MFEKPLMREFSLIIAALPSHGSKAKARAPPRWDHRQET